MRQMLFDAKKRAFFYALAVVVTVIMVGCGDDPVTPDDLPEGISHVNKYVAKPSPYTGEDRITYSFSSNGYDFYYIHLGTLEDAPVFFLDPMHFGTNAEMTYQFTTETTSATTMRETIAQSSETVISKTDQKTTNKTTGAKLSTEISASYEVSDDLQLGAKMAGEANWSNHVQNTSTTEFTGKTSLTNTVEHISTYTEKQVVNRTWTLSQAKGDRAGWYRYALFYAFDVYLYVIKNADGELVHYEFLEHVKPDVYGWKLDYSETIDFSQSDASIFELDISMLNNLPAPTLSFATFPPPENISAMALSSSRITVSWDSVTDDVFYRIYRSTSEDGMYSLVGTSYSPSYADTGLVPVTTYYYKVAAVSGNGHIGMFSVEVHATTKSPMRPTEYGFEIPGNHTMIFDRTSPVQVEIYMLGAGSGGQGGSRSSIMGGYDRGTGASGGGGAATYVKFIVDAPVTFDITVGTGGTGGSYSDRALLETWRSGGSGSAGENTTVTVGTATFIAEGGGRSGGTGDQTLNAGIGGRSGSRPLNLEDWASEAGEDGVGGIHPGDLRETNHGGAAGLITDKGSKSTFGGGLGGTSTTQAEAGGGGRPGHADQAGASGGHGLVLIVLTEI
jgi:hypothetical protein